MKKRAKRRWKSEKTRQEELQAQKARRGYVFCVRGTFFAPGEAIGSRLRQVEPYAHKIVLTILSQERRRYMKSSFN